MSKLLYITDRGGLLYTYKIVDGVAIIYDPSGSEYLRGSNDPSITDKEKEEWGIATTNQYNKTIVTEILNSKIKELDDVYVEAELSRVTLSDGNVFNASKTRGNNPNRSLNNTIDLIKKAVEFSIYFKQENITLSDADNNDVVYDIMYNDGVGDPYILPIVEIGMYMNMFFTLKRTIGNSIYAVCSMEKINTNQEINVDNLLDIHPRELFTSARYEQEQEIINKKETAVTE